MAKGTSETLTKIVSFSPETVSAIVDLATELREVRKELTVIEQALSSLVNDIRVSLRVEMHRASGYELEVEPPIKFPVAE